MRQARWRLIALPGQRLERYFLYLEFKVSVLVRIVTQSGWLAAKIPTIDRSYFGIDEASSMVLTMADSV